MSRLLSPLICTLTLVACGTASSPTLADCGTDSARMVHLGVSYSARPYVFPHSDRGIQLDIIRGALQLAGYRLCPVYAPSLRGARRFEQGELDALLNVRRSQHGGYVSQPVIEYHNCLYSLARRELRINRFSELAGLRVAAFQRARRLLPEDFTQVIPLMAEYQEVADQAVQVQLLFRRRVDLIVIDRRIFTYYRQSTQADAPVDAHCLLEPAPYSIEFADAQVRDDFDEGLAKLRESSDYNRIIQSYQPTH